MPLLAGKHRRPVQVNITIPLSVLLGLSDAPAEIDTTSGPESLTAQTARQLAFSDDATWRRILTDPVSGTILDVGRTRYQPPAGLLEHIIIRDRTCRYPTTTTPARSCEIDHTVPFSDGGTTSDRNLGALSGPIHTHVTLHPFDVEQPEPGTFHWKTPAGLTYTIHPEPTDEPGNAGDPDDVYDYATGPLTPAAEPDADETTNIPTSTDDETPPF